MDLATVLILFSSSTQWRRSKAVKNILIGRRTVSNLYWALQYQLLPDFGALHGALSNDVEQAVSRLKRQHLVTSDDELRLLLTKQGVAYQNKLRKQLPNLAALTTAAQFDIFRFADRLALATQVVSEYSYANNRYYPQEIGLFDTQLVKRWFLQNKDQALPQYLYTLFNRFLTMLKRDDFAVTFVQGLSGHQLTGETDLQIAKEQGTTPTVVSLTRLILMAQLFNQLHESRKSKMALLIQGLAKPVIAVSAQKTLTMFCRFPDLSLLEIARRRRIKLTTVQEHLLEAAIVLPEKQVPVQQLLASSVEEKLASAQPHDLANWSFQEAGQKIAGLDFFSFRLFQIQRLKRAQRKV